MSLICPNCGKSFNPKNSNQKFCCKKCQRQSQRKGIKVGYPVISFTCAKCGRPVTTTGGNDKRSRFCCKDCEKQYWRHPPEAKRSQIRNMVSASYYAYYERKTNNCINTAE